ncbi:hypothetical protein QTP88_023089 [Uroleucon formosanum]
MTYNYVAGRFIIRWNHDFFPGFGGGGGGGVYDSRKLLVTTATTCGQVITNSNRYSPNAGAAYECSVQRLETICEDGWKSGYDIFANRRHYIVLMPDGGNQK